MNDLFSLKNILSNPRPTTSLVKKPINETYLNTAIAHLREFNTKIDTANHDMYICVSESASRDAENQKFGNYFKEYKSILDTYSRNMNELISKAIINITTYIDSNKSIIDDADNICIIGTPKVQISNFENLNNQYIPYVDIYQLYKKEFAFIGKTMQDLGSAITDDCEKTKILSSICNNLKDELQTDWLEKSMHIILGEPNNINISQNDFATMVYEKFNSGSLYDTIITPVMVKQAKLDLSNISILLDGLSKSNEDFSNSLAQIAEEIGSLFFRNKDQMMPIKTDKEGIADGEYKLSPSAFNQFNIFMATKCTQITEICNLYLMAMSIKIDAIFKYVKQNINIIETAKNGYDNTDIDDMDNFDNDIDMNDNSSFLQLSPDDSTTSCAEESLFDEASYLFEANVFELERAFSQYNLQKEIESIMEADNISSADNKNDGIGQKIKALLQKIMDNISKFFDFKSKSIDRYIQQLKKADYQKALKNAPIPNGMTIDWIDTTKLQSITISNKNFNDTNLDNIDTYIKSAWSNVLNKDAALKSITDDILNSISDTGRMYTDNEREASIDFLLNKFNTTCNDTKTAIEKLKSGLDNDLRAAQNGQLTVSESTLLEQMIATYFIEADSAVSQNNKNQTMSNNNTQHQNANTSKNNNSQVSNSSASNNSTPNQNNKTESYGDASNDKKKKVEMRINNYYTANIRVLSAKLNLLKTTATKQIDFLKHIPINNNNNDTNKNSNNSEVK